MGVGGNTANTVQLLSGEVNGRWGRSLELHMNGRRRDKHAATNKGRAGMILPALRFRAAPYLATRNWVRLVPIVLNTVPSPLDDVTIQNLSGPLAQFCSNVDFGSPLVLTWMV